MLKHIVVTKEDIESGRRRDSFSCPVANAIRRQCSVHSLHVLPYSVVWGNALSLYSAPKSTLPYDVEKTILRYDGGINIEPFEFDLEIPDEVVCE